MDFGDERGYPFLVDDLWKPSVLAVEAPSSSALLQWESGVEIGDSDLVKVEKLNASLPDLKSQYLHLQDFDSQAESLSAFDESNTSSGEEYHNVLDVQIRDTENDLELWNLEDVVGKIESPGGLISWDTFLNPAFQEPASAYLCDAGPKGYDAALRMQSKSNSSLEITRLANPDIFISSLYELGLGRDSVLFAHDNTTQSLIKIHGDVQISGVSLTVADSLIKDFENWGSAMRQIRRFVSAATTTHYDNSAVLALASAVNGVILAVEYHLVQRRPQSSTALQSHAVFKHSGTLVKAINGLISSISSARSRSAVISAVFDETERLGIANEAFGSLLYEIMRRVAEPWLLSLQGWIGLRQAPNQRAELASLRADLAQDREERHENKHHTQEPECIPRLLSAEPMDIVLECGHSFDMLQEHHPGHPLCASKSGRSDGDDKLQWALSWKEIEALQARASSYETSLREAITHYNADSKRSIKSNGSTKSDHEFDETARNADKNWARLCDIDSTESLGRGLGDSAPLNADKIFQLTIGNLSGTDPGIIDFGPPMSSSMELSFSPLVSAQARLVEYSCLHMLFKESRLSSHLKLQRRFHLMGDGIFVTRLSQALFDPNQHSGERKAGVMRSGVSTGLRLGSRDSWPPASSELRLVLMGILSESYASDPATCPGQPEDTGDELPGGLSFAIRELSEDELEKCKMPDALEALDFLRLQYKPPPVIEAVITQSCLHKYDRLFKYLLRLLRLRAVVTNLIRQVSGRDASARWKWHKFSVEAYHFIITLSEYSSTCCIDSVWVRLEELCAQTERCLDRSDFEGVIGYAKSLHKVREFHTGCLDQILHNLFLSKSHNQVMTLIEDAFSCILRLAVALRHEESPTVKKEEYATITRLHGEFKRKVGLFVRFLQDTEDKAPRKSPTALGIQRPSDDEAVSRQLLARLQMKSYY